MFTNPKGNSPSSQKTCYNIPSNHDKENPTMLKATYRAIPLQDAALSTKSQNTSTVYLSRLASPSLQSFLQGNSFRLESIDVPVVYPEISTHADILLCQLGLWEKAQIFHGDPEKLTRNYPGNIRYNAVCTGKYFIHNLQYTDPDLLAAAEAKAAAEHTSLTKIHIKQGYTRCSLLPVDDQSFITSDTGIATTLADYDTDVLLIRPGHILLPGFDYGFIGGTGGGLLLAGRRLLVINGNIETHPDHKKIATFLEDRDIDLYYSKDSPLMDIGSILVDAAPKPLQQPVRE